MNKRILIITAALLVGAGVGFNALGGMAWLDALGVRGPEKALQHRVEGYWSARVDGDLERMAEYMHPFEEQLTQPGMLVTEAYEVLDVKVAGESASAVIWTQSRLKHPKLSARTREKELRTEWVLHEGTWYRALGPDTISDAIKHRRGEWIPPQPGGASSEDVSSNGE